MKSHLKLLIIADCHSLTGDEIEKINGLTYDLCFLLGDICDKYLQMISKIVQKEKIYGVLGNHDEYGLLEENDIPNIHLKTIEYEGVTFMGYEGSNRYKRGNFVMHTQEESLQDLKNQPKVDILISHEGPYEFYTTNFSHIGFKGISEYLIEGNVWMNIHGHHHFNSQKSTVYGTEIICVYKCAIIDLATSIVETIF